MTDNTTFFIKSPLFFCFVLFFTLNSNLVFGAKSTKNDYVPTKTPVVSESLYGFSEEKESEEIEMTSLETEQEDELLAHYPHWTIPESVIETIQSDKHLGGYGSLAPDLLEKIQHSVTDQTLINEGIVDLLSVGVTDVGNSKPDRIFNIEHSLGKYDGMIVQPGEIFSFLDILGPVYEEDYKETKVIYGGESVTGLGGGVCQTSTTMRRAALFAGLEELDRKTHTFAVYHYGPLQGLDTAVWSPWVDYQFKNNTDNPIFIRTEIQGTKVMVFFYGKKDRDTVLLHQDQTGGIMTGIKTTWVREIYKYGEAEPVIESWTSKYNAYKKGDE